MKKLLLSAMLLATTLMSAQEAVNISMGAGYSNEVYYKLDTQTETIFTAASWDVAFLRNNPVDVGVRVNDGIGIKYMRWQIHQEGTIRSMLQIKLPG